MFCQRPPIASAWEWVIITASMALILTEMQLVTKRQIPDNRHIWYKRICKSTTSLTIFGITLTATRPLKNKQVKKFHCFSNSTGQDSNKCQSWLPSPVACRHNNLWLMNGEDCPTKCTLHNYSQNPHYSCILRHGLFQSIDIMPV